MLAATLRTAGKRSGLLASLAHREFAAQAGESKTILAVLYKAGDAAKEKRLLGCVENELGLREWLESQGHKFIVTSDKEGENCEFEKHLPEANVVITTPFWPGYVTPERVAKAKKLELALTAGIGSDHVDLPAASKAGITVAEITGSNVVSVAEHVVMMILSLVRNYMTGYHQVLDGEWNIGAIAKDAFDLEGKVVGTVGAGRIGQRVLKRLHGFDCEELLYTDFKQLPPKVEGALKARYVEDVKDMVSQCDVVTINCPLHEGTKGLFDKEMIGCMKKGSYLVNTARGAICDTQAVKEALESGHLRGYAGDVWFPQPAPKDHPWRTIIGFIPYTPMLTCRPHHAMTPHYSGTTLDAQARYAAGTKDVLQRFFAGTPLKKDDVIVEGGKMAAQYDQTAKERNLDFEKGWEK